MNVLNVIYNQLINVSDALYLIHRYVKVVNKAMHYNKINV